MSGREGGRRQDGERKGIKMLIALKGVFSFVFLWNFFFHQKYLFTLTIALPPSTPVTCDLWLVTYLCPLSYHLSETPPGHLWCPSVPSPSFYDSSFKFSQALFTTTLISAKREYLSENHTQALSCVLVSSKPSFVNPQKIHIKSILKYFIKPWITS